jgi:predicted alpha/beta hydrolase family esterase
MPSTTLHYLIVPGWHGSPDEHWQSHWQRVLPSASRVEQHDWLWPQRDAWVEQLQLAIAAAPGPVMLIAHSLGCITTAQWASQADVLSLRKVKGALLVAPADVERHDCPQALQNFAPISRKALPFASLLVGSGNDTAATPERAVQLAEQWGSEWLILPDAGHINIKSGHRTWELGFAWLYRLQRNIQRAQRLQCAWQDDFYEHGGYCSPSEARTMGESGHSGGKGSSPRARCPKLGVTGVRRFGRPLQEVSS